jgi:mono/diheme cytochrome c family protein
MTHIIRNNIRCLRVAVGLLLVSCATTSNAAGDQSAVLGRALYTNCAGCHGVSGEGGFGPPLAHSENLKDDRYVISHVLTGSANMPNFRDQLSPEEIAAVINYVRHSWGNLANGISAVDVQSELSEKVGR